MKSVRKEVANARSLRQKAEKLLKENKDKIVLPVFEADEKKLLHELQVHQIELEMQNEQLREAVEVAETALRKFTMLYDLAPMGYLTLGHDGTICELNFTAAYMLGEKRFSMVNNNIKLFINNDSLSVFNNFLDKVFKSQSKESCEVKLGQDGNHTSVFMEGVVTGEDRSCLLSVVDISILKK
jgi:PAS domain-containing protein